ncbi:MAG: hypothetical protein WAM42_00375 [Candidatus Nitrosopolaris sp.]
MSYPPGNIQKGNQSKGMLFTTLKLLYQFLKQVIMDYGEIMIDGIEVLIERF